MFPRAFKHSLLLAAAALIPLGCANPQQQGQSYNTSHHVSFAPIQGKTHTRDAKFEQDRKAILDMVGEFDVTFRFKENLGLIPDYKLKKTYLSQASEKVYLVADEGDRIVLQHILVVGEDRKHTVKHWLQEWKYEDQTIYAFQGNKTWQPTHFSQEQAKGKWTQLVTQVDDSPRYESYGQWVHTDNVSYWESGVTWRPLPRREYSKRSDYDVLVARNRQTITPTGWVHEQDNEKLALRDGNQTIIAREKGINTYTKVSGKDFSAADQYWEATQAYWADVRQAWQNVYAQNQTLILKKKVEKQVLYRHFFEYAAKIQEDGKYDAVDGKRFIDETIQKFQITGSAKK